MSESWRDYAVLSHEEAEARLAADGFILAAIHRAFVDGDWMAVCRIAWELMMRKSNQQGSTGRK